MNQLKKTTNLGITLVLLFSVTVYADINQTIEKIYDFAPNGHIQLSNINGDVSITACDCKQITLMADISASSQAVRDRITIDIKHSSDNFRVKTQYKNNYDRAERNQHSEVVYTLSVPKDVNLDAIELVNGHLTIRGVAGIFRAELVNGNLKADGLRALTQISLVNGDMNVHFKDLTHASRIDLESVNGAIKLHLPSHANADIEAETVNGKISNEFGLEVIKHKYVGSEMKGMIGTGGTKIQLENVNGKIALNKE